MTQLTQPDANSSEPSEKTTSHRKYNVTINNPDQHGFSHSDIAEALQSLKGLIYYCMADEEGETYHTHIFAAFSSVVRFSTMKRSFPPAHIEPAKGTAAQNRAYILKEGKWASDEKHGTSIPNTIEEYGEMPVERQGARNDLELLYDLIKEGKTNAEILEINPRFMMFIDKIDKVRQTLLYEKAREEYRNLEVIYIYGPTRVGKTRYVMEKYGYSSVYKVTDYTNPFDQYLMEPVLLLDEYHSSIKFNELYSILDGYPVALKARYNNKIACFSTVYMVSNIELIEQYPQLRHEHPQTWDAFASRFTRIMHFHRDGTRKEYSTEEYLKGFVEVEMDDDPFKHPIE